MVSSHQEISIAGELDLDGSDEPIDETSDMVQEDSSGNTEGSDDE
jgi:hypothetical protein